MCRSQCSSSDGAGEVDTAKGTVDCTIGVNGLVVVGMKALVDGKFDEVWGDIVVLDDESNADDVVSNETNSSASDCIERSEMDTLSLLAT